MFTTINQLCTNLQKPISAQSYFDSISAKLFHHNHDFEYVMSSVPPPLERYNIKIDDKYINYRNELISNFDLLGPNEKYLTNKILYCSSSPLLIVGGIGVGKSKFLHYLTSNILTNFIHSDDADCVVCPLVINLDLLKFNETVFCTSNESEMVLKFSEWLCDKVETIIHDNFFTIDYEVKIFFDDIIKSHENNYYDNSAILSLLCKLQENDAHMLINDSTIETTVKVRKQLRSALFSDVVKRRNYLAALLKFIKATYYKNHEHCMILIVDNIDQEPAPVIRAINKVIKPFCNLSSVKTIVSTRQTTYSHYFDDGFTEPVECAPYCGAGPIDIIISRLDNLILDPTEFIESCDHDKDHIVEAAKMIKALLVKESTSSLIRDICGNSNRTALLLAQRLFNNGVYLPIIDKNSETDVIKIPDINKALMVGLENSYVWDEMNPVENIFEVNGHPCGSYFIKLRILRIIGKQQNNKLKINALINILSAFGYTNDLIYDAIHQLMQKRKRLIWSDAVRSFESEEQLFAHGTSHLSLTDSGKGYGFNLYNKLLYIEEVMLGTNVLINNDILANIYDYNKWHERFNLVHGFIRLLHKEDVREITIFNHNSGALEYYKAFKEKSLLSKQIASGLELYIRPMIENAKKNIKPGTSPEHMLFLENHISDYNYLIHTAEEAERKLLCA